MEIRFSLGLDDLQALADYHSQTSDSARRQLRAARLGVALLMVLLAAATYGLRRDAGAAAFALGFAVLWALFLPRLQRALLRRQLARLYRAGQARGAYRGRALALGPDGLIERTPHGAAELSWQAIARVDSTPGHTFLFVGPSQAIILPRAGVEQGDYQVFVDELRRRHTAARAVPDER